MILPVQRVDLLLLRSARGRVLITPLSGRGRLALRQLCDASMPRIGDALLLTAEQGEAIELYLRSLRLSVRPWQPFPLLQNATSPAPPPQPAAGRAPSPTPPGTAASPQPSATTEPAITSAELVCSSWPALSRRCRLSVLSILSLPPGGEQLSISLPPGRDEQFQ